MKRSRIIFLLIGFLVLTQGRVLASPLPPTAAEKIQFQLWPEYRNNLVTIVSAVQYPATAKLPIRAIIALPKGSRVTWAGEIGAVSSQDIDVDPMIVDKGDYTEVSYLLTKNRTAQVEAEWDGVKKSGSSRTVAFDWVQRYDSKTTEFMVKTPSGASEVKMTPSPMRSSISPEKLVAYFSVPLNYKVGERHLFKVTYKRSSDAASVATQADGSVEQTQSGGSSADVLPYFVVGLAVAGSVFAIYRRTRMSDE